MNPFEHSPSSVDEETFKKTLFSNAMESNWQEVIDIYTQNPKSRTAKITRSGDTALHVAISDGQDSIVETLVKMAAETPGALSVANEHGNTPLHLAAYLGNVNVCRWIAARDSKLIGKRNKESETPIFLAVSHGRKDAFLCLHSFCKSGEGYAYCRRSDGETILHSAISGEYFDIAFQIIHLYDKLLNSVNERGLSPLHLLASKPSVFRSGSHIRGFRKLIYYCIFVDKLEEKFSYSTPSQDPQFKSNGNYPENYQTCVGFILVLTNILRLLLGYSNKQSDEEDPNVQQLVRKQVGSSKNWTNQQADEEKQPPHHHKQGQLYIFTSTIGFQQ